MRSYKQAKLMLASWLVCLMLGHADLEEMSIRLVGAINKQAVAAAAAARSREVAMEEEKLLLVIARARRLELLEMKIQQ